MIKTDQGQYGETQDFSDSNKFTVSESIKFNVDSWEGITCNEDLANRIVGCGNAKDQDNNNVVGKDGVTYDNVFSGGNGATGLVRNELDDYLDISVKERKLLNLFADQALFQSVFGFSVQDHIENRRVPMSSMMSQLTQLIEERRGELLASQTWTQSSRLGLDS